MKFEIGKVEYGGKQFAYRYWPDEDTVRVAFGGHQTADVAGSIGPASLASLQVSSLLDRLSEESLQLAEKESIETSL